MDLRHFFEPVKPQDFADINTWKSGNVGNSITMHSEDDIPDLQNGDLVLLGIKTSPDDDGPDWIRKFFYKLKMNGSSARLLDVGNFMLDKNDDTKVKALTFALSELLDQGVCPMIVGGSQEVTYLNYQAYESLDQMVNLVVIDKQIDFSYQEESRLKPDTFLQNILLSDHSYLFNMSLLGLQHYLTGDERIGTFHDMYFDLYRLGQIRDNFHNIEPIIRHGDFLSFDLSSIRQSDAPGNNNPSPNGFYGEEACTLAKFAGLSENISSMGFHEYNSAFDREGQTAQLTAQMLWHLMAGYMARQQEHPRENEEAFYKYITTLKEQAYQIVFFKSKKTDRWWMEVPIDMQNPHFQSQALIPCAYDDYIAATRDEIPERWWHALQKLS